MTKTVEPSTRALLWRAGLTAAVFVVVWFLLDSLFFHGREDVTWAILVGCSHDPSSNQIEEAAGAGCRFRMFKNPDAYARERALPALTVSNGTTVADVLNATMPHAKSCDCPIVHCACCAPVAETIL